MAALKGLILGNWHQYIHRWGITELFLDLYILKQLLEISGCVNSPDSSSTPNTGFSCLSSSQLPNMTPTDLALSFWCLSPTRPVLKSAQVKVSSRISSPGFIAWPPVSSPSPALNRTSCPLLGLWTSWKISRSVGLSGSFTWSRDGDSGAKPSRGTSREPLMWRAGGWVFTEKKTGEKRVRIMKWKNSCSFIKAELNVKNSKWISAIMWYHSGLRAAALPEPLSAGLANWKEAAALEAGILNDSPRLIPAANISSTGVSDVPCQDALDGAEVEISESLFSFQVPSIFPSSVREQQSGQGPGERGVK